MLWRLQGEFDFSEGASAKWIFDVEIEKLRAEVLFTCREDQNRAFCPPDATDRAFTTNIYNFIFTFPASD